MRVVDPASPSAPPILSRILEQAHRREPEMIARLRELVEIETPSSTKAAVDQAMRVFASWAQAAGASTRRHTHRDYGDSLELSFARDGTGRKPTLLLGHLDTVWELGTLATMPWSATGERIAGPGVLDMKAGAVMALTAIEMLCALDIAHPPVILLLHGDEEVGSPASRPVTESVASGCESVFVLEPAQGEQGAYKTARKAVGTYRLEVHGVASHSGVDFEAGHSAILELARQIQTVSTFTESAKGITVNAGLIQGGTRSNVVAAEAWAEIDVRIARLCDLAPLEEKFRSLRSTDPGCELVLQGGINRPPMERTPGTVILFERARKFAGELGFALEEAATGGGSDGNFTSALGVPTLDGMGAVGGGAHALHEHLERKHLAPRTALLAAMLAGLD